MFSLCLQVAYGSVYVENCLPRKLRKSWDGRYTVNGHFTTAILEWFKYTVGYPATFCFSVLAILNVDTSGSDLPAQLGKYLNLKQKCTAITLWHIYKKIL